MIAQGQEFTKYIRIVRHWWKVLILGSIIAAGTGYGVSKRMQPIYQASTSLFVNTASVTANLGSYTDPHYGLMLATAIADMVKSYRVANMIIQRLHLKVGAAALLAQMQAVASPDTPILTIVVKDPSRERAALLANVAASTILAVNNADQSVRFSTIQDTIKSQIAGVNRSITAANARLRSLSARRDPDQATIAQINSLTALANSLQNNLASLNTQLDNVLSSQAQSSTTLTIIDRAQVPSSPVSPDVKKNTALAFVVGLLLTVGVIVVLEYLNDSLQSPTFIEEKLKMPVLGTISRIAAEKGSVMVANKAQDRNAEAFKILRTNIQFMDVDKPPRSLLVTSPRQGDGKSTIVANYAVAVAQTGQRVVLIDADLRRPSLHRIFGLGSDVGLTDVLRTPELGLGVLRDSGVENLQVLFRSSIPPNPSELLGSRRMTEFMELVTANADVVIVDTPPVLVVTDAAVLANRVDGVILVLDTVNSTMRAAAHALQSLRLVGAHVLGTVVNRFEVRSSRYSDYYYYHYYSAEYKPNGPAQSSRRKRLAIGAGRSSS